MKIGRNEKCPCGSGLKYKKCHGAIGNVGISDRGKPREKIYGSVRRIVHETLSGQKIVVVGNQSYTSPNWKTFTDFLDVYLQGVLGREWWEREVGNRHKNPHPIIKWAFEKHEYLTRNSKRMGQINSITPNGPTIAYLCMAYDLYLLQDNLKLQSKLVKRLKNKDQFDGARFEAQVASIFLRAGLDFVYSDESDISKKHPEFVAVDITGGAMMAVEAKSRNRIHADVPETDIKLGVTNLLIKAVEKFDGMPLVIFVNLNVPHLSQDFQKTKWFNELQTSLNRKELKNDQGKDKFSSIIFINFPIDFSKSSAPAYQNYYVYSKNSAAPLKMRTFNRIVDAIQTYIAIPNFFED